MWLNRKCSIQNITKKTQLVGKIQEERGANAEEEKDMQRRKENRMEDKDKEKSGMNKVMQRESTTSLVTYGQLLKVTRQSKTSSINIPEMLKMCRYSCKWEHKHICKCDVALSAMQLYSKWPYNQHFVLGTQTSLWLFCGKPQYCANIDWSLRKQRFTSLTSDELN